MEVCACVSDLLWQGFDHAFSLESSQHGEEAEDGAGTMPKLVQKVTRMELALLNVILFFFDNKTC